LLVDLLHGECEKKLDMLMLMHGVIIDKCPVFQASSKQSVRHV